MNRQRAWLWLFSAALAMSFFILPVRSWADDNDYDNNNQDPPSRVATMNYIRGSVSFQPGGEGDWVDAVQNRPLIAGDNIWTDRGSRAEMHVGSTAVRLDSETSVTLLDLDDNTLQLRVAEGTVMVRMLHMDQDDLVEIDTPNVAFRVTRAGEFRVDVRSDGRTTIIEDVHGRGEVVGGGNTYTLVAGQVGSFTGDDYLTYDIDSLPNPDEFDLWGFERDRREDQCRAANYVSREMTGYEDLDDYGAWTYAGDYGQVWIPSGVAYDWAPYRYGHWVWIAPWGWTWVDDEPWGFAPFHYGRWIVIGGRWAWVPGPVVARPVYAPALVAFVGGGGFQFSVSFGGGPGIAWFPLAPGEVFVPSYHVSRTYVNQVNITNTVVNVTKVTNVYNYYKTNNTTEIAHVNYINRTQLRGVTAVSRETFVNARPVAKNTVVLQRQDIERAPVGHVPTVEPVKTSVVGIGNPTRKVPPPAIVNRRVVADRIPSPPPTPFAQRQDKLMVRPVTPPTQQVRPMPPVNRGDARNDRMDDRSDDRGNRPEPPAMRQQPVQSQPAVNPPAANSPAQRPEWQRPAPNSPAVMTQPAPPQRPDTVNPPGQPGRPQVTEPPRPPQARQPMGNEDENQVRPQQGWTHPLARPAPPVQPKSEQQVKEEETKFHNWEQKQRPAPQAPPQRQENKKDDKKDDKKH